MSPIGLYYVFQAILKILCYKFERILYLQLFLLTESLKVGPPCKIDYPTSSPTSKDESTPQNGISEAITKMASTVKLSSLKSPASDIHSDFSPEVTTAANSEDLTDSLENADKSQGISSSSTSFSISTHSSSIFSGISDLSSISEVSGSTTADSEVQISAPQSVKTATPHSEGYPDFEDENERYELGPSTSQSPLQNDEKSSRDYKINQEMSEITFSPADAASQSRSESVTLLQTNKNTSATCKIANVSPIIYNSTEITKFQTTSSVSSVTEESKLQETVAENISYSSRKISPENSESDQEMQTGVPLEGEEDQIVSTIESYWFQENVTASSTTENKIYTLPSEANDNLAVQKEMNTSTEIETTVHLQEITQPNQLEQIYSIANISATTDLSTNIKNTMRAETCNDQSYEISKSSVPLAISISRSSAANISENHITGK